MQCNLCGKEEVMYEVEIEGTIMKVGRNCAGFGKVIKKTEKERFSMPKRIENIVKKEEPIKIIVKDYHSIVKDAREKQGIKQEDFAKKISEKTSVIHNIESGRTEPNISLAEKLEKTLGIKIVEDYINEKVSLSSAGTNVDMTIGSVVNIKHRKKS